MEEVINTINLLNNASRNGKITSKLYNDKINECIKDMSTLAYYKQKVMEISERKKFEEYARNANRFDYECDWYPMNNNTFECPYDNTGCPGFPPGVKCPGYTFTTSTTLPKFKSTSNINSSNLLNIISDVLDYLKKYVTVMYKLIFIAMDKEKYECGKYKETVLPLIKNVLSEYYSESCTNFILLFLEKFSEELFEKTINNIYNTYNKDKYSIDIMKTTLMLYESMNENDHEKAKEHGVTVLIMLIQQYFENKQKKTPTKDEEINLDDLSGDDILGFDVKGNVGEVKPEVSNEQDVNNDTKKRKYE